MQLQTRWNYFLNGPTPAFFIVYFGLFKQTPLQILQQINVKNVHPVYGAGIRTHNLQNMSLLPLPLDQGSRPDAGIIRFEILEIALAVI